MSKKYDLVVIGAGLGGIAAALRLRKKGYAVVVLEKNESYGGKLSEFRWEGYRWDKGPSLFTLPHQVDELFELFGKNPRDFFDYHKMDESCHYYFKDGSDFLFRSDPQLRNQDLIEHFNEKEGQAAVDYIAESAKTYKAIGDLFIDRPKYGLKNIFDRDLIKRYPMLVSRKLMRSLNAFNESKFTDPNLIQVFNRYATYNGSDPYKMSGLYSMIPHLEMNDGTYFPKQGMRSIVGSLYNLAAEQGIDFLFEQTDIRMDKTADGYAVKSGDKEFEVEKVVSAIDCVYFYEKIVRDQRMAQKYARKERSASALVFYWAVEKIIPELKLHNIFFSPDYKQEFTRMFDLKEAFEMPTVYIHISSTVNPEDAPPNGQNWFVMINLTAGVEVTAEKKEMLRNYVYKVIQDKFGADIAPHIKYEDSWDQATIGAYTGAYKGALYGAASNDKMAAITRHGNTSKKYKNVFFCGGTVHPGGGIPLVLKSAKIAADLIEPKK